MEGALGRRVPPDWRHVERFPLSAAAAPPVGVPVVLGTQWLTGMDQPVKRGQQYWVSADGPVRGGHAYCLRPRGAFDTPQWWDFYDQGHEGACVGFGSARMLSLFNRARFDARWIWDQAKTVDVWPDTNPGDDNGTSVRAAMDVLRNAGAPRVKRGVTLPPTAAISANRWATSADEVLAALGTPELDYVTILNSWGRSYPHYVRLPAADLQRLLEQDGEAAVPTDA